MARSPLTLAASATAALPGATIVAVAPLSTGSSGRFDAAVVDLEGGDRLVVRASTDDLGASELAAESIALRALTPGARSLLPFDAPSFHGEATMSDGRILASGFVPGYAVDAADLPGGPGAASSLGIALAAIHALPPSVVRAVGLPIRSAADARDAVRATLQRAIDTRHVPVALASRWQAAVDDDALWVFEPTVVLGDAGADSFRFEDRADVPTVVGVVGWHALAVGDPAADLQWIVSAVDASGDVLETYVDSASRTPDPHLPLRMRLYAELEFAKWLVHANEDRRDDVLADAVSLLDALVDGLADAAPLTSAAEPEPDAFGPPIASASLAAAAIDDPSTAMQTDAYDPRLLSLFAASEDEHDDTVPVTRGVVVDADSTPETAAASPADRRTAALLEETAPLELEGDSGPIPPVELSAWAKERQDAADRDETDSDVERDAERASRAAFQRWASSASE